MDYLTFQAPEATHNLLSNCREKVQLHLEHRVRIKNQREAIENVIEFLNSNKTVVLMDLKMNFKMEHYRGKHQNSAEKMFIVEWNHVLLKTHYTKEI